MWFLFLFGLVAIGAGIAYRRRSTLIVGAMTFLAGTVFCGWELLRDILGKAPAWNLRLLPFWYLMLYLLAALGAAEIARWIGQFVAWVSRGWRDDGDVADAADAPVDAPADADAELDGEPVAVPAKPREGNRHLATRLVVIGVVAALFATVALVRINATKGYVTYWAKYNYTGYEGGTVEDATKKDYAEYRAFIDTVNALPPGRLLWEPSSDIGRYGTPLALMMLPYWTDGRISSMEGLYYESSATTPYHFLTAATLTSTPSNAVRGLPYRNSTDFALGVRYLQLMGVRYYAAMPDMQALAATNASLREVATVPDLDVGAPLGWKIYEVADSPSCRRCGSNRWSHATSTPTRTGGCEAKPEPAPGTPGGAELSAWECLAVPWFDDPAALDRPLTDDGPASWQRSEMLDARRVAKKALPDVKVTNVHHDDDSISFDVSRTGVPGDGEVVVLPELAGRRRRRPVAGDAPTSWSSSPPAGT